MARGKKIKKKQAPVPISIPVSMDLLHEIEEFQSANCYPTRAAAIRDLLHIALDLHVRSDAEEKARHLK